MNVPKPTKHFWSLQGLLAPVWVEQHVKQLDGVSLFLPSMCPIPICACVVCISWPVTVLQILNHSFQIKYFSSNKPTCHGAVLQYDFTCIRQFTFKKKHLYFWDCYNFYFHKCSIKITAPFNFDAHLRI